MSRVTTTTTEDSVVCLNEQVSSMRHPFYVRKQSPLLTGRGTHATLYSLWRRWPHPLTQARTHPPSRADTRAKTRADTTNVVRERLQVHRSGRYLASRRMESCPWQVASSCGTDVTAATPPRCVCVLGPKSRSSTASSSTSNLPPPSGAPPVDNTPISPPHPHPPEYDGRVATTYFLVPVVPVVPVSGAQRMVLSNQTEH